MEKGEVLIKVEGVSKKFCRNLKRSLWYGVTDIGRSMVGMNGNGALRKDEFWAVRDVSFEVRRGECLGLIGHNGAGKSTLLKMLNGLIRPDEGRIEMHGRIGALIELGAGFNPVLTGRENVYNNGAVLGFTKEEIDRKLDDIVAFAELKEFIDMPVQNYSSGMKVRLGFAVASQMEPDILIIDEVLAVGDIGFQVKCFNAIQQIAKNAVVIFVSHSMPNIARTADVICLMKGGMIDYIGRDINNGIVKYFNEFVEEGYSITGKTVNISGLEIFDIENGNRILPSSTLDSFTSLKIRYNINLHEFEVGEYKIVYVFFDQTLRQVAQYVTDLFCLKESVGIRKIDVQLRRVNFTSGKFNLGIAFYKIENNKLNIYTFHKNIFSIQFKSSNYVTNSLIAFEGTQEISE
jgi:lipopolysaccharide transport system ATP-binding protein